MSLNGGYAMIKFNSTQEELAIAYKSKRPALFYDENQRAHWAVIEETATQSVDEETQEPITLYEYSYRLIDEESGSEVHLYRHLLRFEDDTYIEIYASNSTPLTMNLLKENYQGRYFANREFNVTQSKYATISRYVQIELSKVQVFYFEINLSANTMNLTSGTLSNNPVDTITQIF